jgi:hypothetical protein
LPYKFELEKRQAAEEISSLKSLLSAREDFEEKAAFHLTMKRLKEDLKKSRINEAQLKLKISKLQSKGKFKRRQRQGFQKG